MNRRLAFCIAFCMIPAGLATGEPLKADPSGVLAGPKVNEEAERPSLVKRSFGGELELLDSRPEVAAVSLLALAEEERAIVNEFFAQRTAAVTAALSENMDLFLRLQAARQAGELAGARPLMREFRQAVAPLIDPPLVEQVASVLPEDSREEFARLVSEYKQALEQQQAADRNRGTESRAENLMQRRRNPSRAAESALSDTRYELSQLLREMARTLSSIVAERRARTDELISAIDATPEQQAEIMSILREAAEGSRSGEGSAGAADSSQFRAESIAKIMAMLDADQRRKLRDFLIRP